MKIVFVIYGLQAGGAERAVTGLANHWVKEHDVTIITLINSTSFYPLNSKIARDYCFEKTRPNPTRFHSFKDMLLRLKILKSHIKKRNPDVVISFMMKTNIYASLISKWLQIPCIVSERANHDLNRLPRIQEIIRNICYRYISKLVVQTEGNKMFYQKTVDAHKIKVIPNGIADNFKILRKRKGKEQIILNVGAFRNGKAQDLLLKSFANCDAPNWKLLFLGDGPNKERFEQLAKEYGIAKQVIFAGAQKDVASYYNKASLFVFTSEHEGFPNALLEALYFGVPSISTNCPHGPADLIEDGVNGFLVPFGDEKLLTKKIQTLIANETLRTKFSQEAIMQSKKYEMQNIAQQWMTLITSITN